MAATMKNVISTINITGFAISLSGLRRTTESMSIFRETRVVRRTDIILLDLVDIDFPLESVYTSLEKFQNRA